MAELARREQFLFKGWDIQFHWIVDVNCMSKYVGETEEPGEALTLDTIVMFTNEKNSKGEWQYNPRIVNRIDISDIQRLNRWYCTVISDIEKRFTDRVVHTIMDEKMFALILLRHGGKPVSDEDFEEMDATDKNAVDAFEKFTNTIRFK